MGSLNYPAYIPSEDDTKLSQESSRILTTYLSPNGNQIEIIEADGNKHQATIPAAAYRLLVDALAQMAQGNAVSLIPIHAELTTQEAADLLNVSRPFLIKQIELGEIPYHKVGKHRRINFNDLMVYEERIERVTAQGLDEMVAISQELGLYD
ncbi:MULTISPECIES: helix-turn-helix domain-containing protein [unclassified Chamaesiphon]|uniref:helix-turn-helix domain-containing protein n=1 Tax=unclassified Chamaesiphon TaxID=2620921 RepID=UPI00286D3996|nr:MULTISPECIES: helix-turn-helix domain-containing protein [unclassified Chamaesiphon]